MAKNNKENDGFKVVTNNNRKDGFKMLLKLSYRQLTHEYNMPTFYINRPKICALYQHTKTDEITDDLQLKYFNMPKPTSYPLDLNKGFEVHNFRKQQTQFQLLDKVLKFVLEANENVLHPDSSARARPPKTEVTSNAQSLPEAEKSALPVKRKLVLCQRGILARLMLIPYRLRGSEGNDLTFYATRYCDILHLVDPSYFASFTKNDSYHGKFEQICFSDDPDLDPITDVPVDDNITTFAIYRSNIKEFDLIYSAEVTGVIANHKIDDIRNLDEINKCKFIQTKLLWNQSQKNMLSHPKCLLWWAQLYLANMDDICIGLKDRDGFIRSPAQLIRVQDMPKNQKWKPTICVRFLATMLTEIEETMSKVNCPYTVYEFKYDSYAGCIKSKIHKDKTKLSFLTEEYINHCKNQTSCK